MIKKLLVVLVLLVLVSLSSCLSEQGMRALTGQKEPEPEDIDTVSIEKVETEYSGNWLQVNITIKNNSNVNYSYINGYVEAFDEKNVSVISKLISETNLTRGAVRVLKCNVNNDDLIKNKAKYLNIYFKEVYDEEGMRSHQLVRKTTKYDLVGIGNMKYYKYNSYYNLLAPENISDSASFEIYQKECLSLVPDNYQEIVKNIEKYKGKKVMFGGSVINLEKQNGIFYVTSSIGMEYTIRGVFSFSPEDKSLAINSKENVQVWGILKGVKSIEGIDYPHVEATYVAIFLN